MAFRSLLSIAHVSQSDRPGIASSLQWVQTPSLRFSEVVSRHSAALRSRLPGLDAYVW